MAVAGASELGHGVTYRVGAWLVCSALGLPKERTMVDQEREKNERAPEDQLVREVPLESKEA